MPTDGANCGPGEKIFADCGEVVECSENAAGVPTAREFATHFGRNLIGWMQLVPKMDADYFGVAFGSCC